MVEYKRPEEFVDGVSRRQIGLALMLELIPVPKFGAFESPLVSYKKYHLVLNITL
jgi:hypothetical protein